MKRRNFFLLKKVRGSGSKPAFPPTIIFSFMWLVSISLTGFVSKNKLLTKISFGFIFPVSFNISDLVLDWGDSQKIMM